MSGFTSSSGALADKFEKDSPFSVEVEHVSASGFYPLCGHDNEHSQEPLEPRGPIKPFDPSADDVKKVKEEVLEGVFLYKTAARRRLVHQRVFSCTKR